MRFTADVKALLPAMQLATAATPARPAQPVLRNVRCAADGGGLTLVGWDTERGCTVPVAAAVAEPGECLLPPRFLAALREYDGMVEVWTEGGGIKAGWHKAGRADPFEYVTEDVADYPVPPDSPPPGFTLPAHLLRTALDRVVFAAAKDDTRYATKGVKWDDGRLVATDGHRLAVADLPGGCGSAFVPPDAMALLRKLLGECDEDADVGVALTAAAAFFTTPAGTVYSRLLEDRFPKYREAMPKDFATTVTLDAADFHADVRRAALATDDESKRVEFDFRGMGSWSWKLAAPLSVGRRSNTSRRASRGNRFGSASTRPI
jgi:DNA polymerase-3 subunit beta